MKGVVLSVAASCLFAVLYYYAVLLRPLDGEQIFGWRMLLTLPALALFLSWQRAWPRVADLMRRLRREPVLWLALPLSAALLGIQLWLFMWAPLHGMALDVSLGYFLLPLSMVVVGRVVLHERLSTLQALAVGFAMLGVGHELWRTMAFSWATAVVMLLYPPYFLVRRWARIEPLPGLLVETLLLLPLCVTILWQKGSLGLLAQAPQLLWQVPLLGIISAGALICYLSASRLLPLGLFGLLGYVEPVLLFVVAVLLLNETFSAQQWLTYGPVWLAVGILAFEGCQRLVRARRGNGRRAM